MRTIKTNPAWSTIDARSPSGVGCRVLALGLMVLVASCDSSRGPWEQARKTDTVEAYESFLRSYPSSRHVAEATERRDFEQARSTSSLVGFRRFVEEHPGSVLLDKAQQNIDFLWSVEWEKAKGGTDAAVEAFRDSGPPPAYADAIRQRLEPVEGTMAVTAQLRGSSLADGMISRTFLVTPGQAYELQLDPGCAGVSLQRANPKNAIRVPAPTGLGALALETGATYRIKGERGDASGRYQELPATYFRVTYLEYLAPAPPGSKQGMQIGF